MNGIPNNATLSNDPLTLFLNVEHMRFLGGYIISGIVVVAITESSNSNSLNKIVYFGSSYCGSMMARINLLST